MRKFKHITIGGIESKIFNLVIFSIILVMAVNAAVIFHQYSRLTKIVRQSSDSQQDAIQSISGETMTAVLDANLTQTTKMEAYIAQDLFGDAERVIKVIADYTEKLFDDPDAYPAREVKLPDLADKGRTTVQLLSEEGVDINDPLISKKIGLIGNLANLMTALYADAKVDSCYCALPEGVMLLVDNHPESKFDGNGGIISIPVRERLWYKGAAETGKLFYTDVTTDLFTNETSIMCSIPVYVNGTLAAVIGADLFLNDISQAVNSVARSGSFICIVNQNGHVLFSPQDEGLFKVMPAEQAPDLRVSDNSQVASFVSDSLEKSTELRLITIDGTEYYVFGAPIRNVGWAVLSVVQKSLADQPGEAMLERLNNIQTTASSTFSDGLKQTRLTMIILLAVVVVITLAAALIISKRIVKPLENITKRVQSISGEDLVFEMEDKYRTHDEIEVLAESFASLSAKTNAYIGEVERITAEKERIGAELSLATRIQADMLPNIYPAFPDRPEFDVYASMDPAKEVGGDFYDFFLVDDDHLCVFIADVSGKGVPAALYMMASMIILENNAAMGKSPAQILQDTNDAICSNNREEMFVTVWLGILEISTGRLLAANAGHEYPVLKKPDGKYELIKDKHGFVIGGMEGMKYKEYELELEPGSKLFLYTDGVPEATNEEKELFGTDRMLEALNSAPDASPKETLEAVRKAVDGFVDDAEQFDDLTMVCVEISKKDSSKI